MTSMMMEAKKHICDMLNPHSLGSKDGPEEGKTDDRRLRNGGEKGSANQTFFKSVLFSSVFFKVQFSEVYFSKA